MPASTSERVSSWAFADMACAGMNRRDSITSTLPPLRVAGSSLFRSAAPPCLPALRPRILASSAGRASPSMPRARMTSRIAVWSFCRSEPDSVAEAFAGACVPCPVIAAAAAMAAGAAAADLASAGAC